MSLLTTLEQTIRSYKAEQAKINDSIQLYREMLQTLTPQVKCASEQSECANNLSADSDISSVEKEDIQLLEQALEKALQVRTASGVFKKDSKRHKQPEPKKEPGAAGVLLKDVIQSSAPCQGSRTNIRLTSKSANLHRISHKSHVSLTLGSKPSARYNPGQSKTINKSKKIQHRPVSSARVVHHQADGKLHQGGSAYASLAHISTLHSKNPTVQSNSDNDLDKGATNFSPSNEREHNSSSEESGASSLLQQNGKPSEQILKWKSLRMKQNRLWDKVIALQKKPMPEKSHFVERMRAMFPKDWPRGSPDQIRALVDRLTHQGHDLIQHCKTEKLLAKHAPEVATELGGKENKYDCNVTLERLHMTPAEIQERAHQVKEEWEAWDRWKPEGGCLCPTGANGVWGDEVTPLPLTITYTTEAELRELENLRMRVALLQQQIYLEQALLETLFPQLSSVLSGPGCPKSSVLRDVYSLLAEGGECFPSTVRDSDPD